MPVAVKYFLLFLIFSVLFVLPAILFPIPFAPDSQPNVDPLAFLAILVVDVVCLVYLVERIELSGLKLFLAVVLVFWGLQTFMTQIETWYFRAAMPAITNEILLKLFLNPFITAVAFTPMGMATLGKWKQPRNEPGHRPTLKSKWKEVLILSVAYMVIYFVFGHYVAWQSAEVRAFYSGTADMPGFFEGMQHNFESDPLLFPFQILRGFLWILCGLPVVLYLKGGNTEKVLVCVFVYSVLTCIQLIIDNPFMPMGVRMAHLWEVSTSNALYGLLIGLVLGRRPPETPQSA